MRRKAASKNSIVNGDDVASFRWFYQQKCQRVIFFLLLLFIMSFEFVVAIDSPIRKKKLKEQDIIQRVLKDYDWRVRPRGNNDTWSDTGGPVLVSVNIYLRSISKIDDVNMEYSAQFTFREEWWDARLAYERFVDQNTEVPPFVVLATSEQADLSQQIWMPDTFFQNEKEARRHLIDKPNVLIRIHSNGTILYSVRLSLVLSCPMSLEYYPLDRQTCLIDLASYAYTTDDIKYEWKARDPIQQKDGLRQSLPSFELQDVLTDYCTSKTNTGEYSCLRTKMILRREFSYYLLQLYIPSCMLVIVSWVSFWLDKDSVPARVTLGVTTLLTMTTQSSGINAKLPPVSYTKAVDVWIGVCMAFIFGALLEFALVNYAARKDITTSQQKMFKMHTSAAAAAAAAATTNDTAAVYQPQQADDGSPTYNQGGYQPLVLPHQQPTIVNPHVQTLQQRRHHSEHSVTLQQQRHHVVHQQQNQHFLQSQHPHANQQQQFMAHHAQMRHPQPRRFCGRCSPFCCRIFVRRYKERSKRIDVVSRLVFPIGYACFNGEYSCARVKLKLKREYSYYLIQLYIPSLMLVVVSWVSFWLDKDAVPARVSLGVTTLLTMTTQASGINSKLPPVSYIKAVDVWIGSCLAFIFSALLEYALVNYCGRREFVRKEKSKKIGNSLFGYQPECYCPPQNAKFYAPPTIFNDVADDANNNASNINYNDLAKVRLDMSGLENSVAGNGEMRAVFSPSLSGLGASSAGYAATPLMPFGAAQFLSSRGTLGQRHKSTESIFPMLKRSSSPIQRFEMSKRVDIVSRFTFPALFLLFLVFYYINYVQ